MVLSFDQYLIEGAKSQNTHILIFYLKIGIKNYNRRYKIYKIKLFMFYLYCQNDIVSSNGQKQLCR